MRPDSVLVTEGDLEIGFALGDFADDYSACFFFIGKGLCHYHISSELHVGYFAFRVAGVYGYSDYSVINGMSNFRLNYAKLGVIFRSAKLNRIISSLESSLKLGVAAYRDLLDKLLATVDFDHVLPLGKGRGLGKPFGSQDAHGTQA